MKKYLLVILTIILFITGCTTPSVKKEKDVIDGIKFKTEYENYNDLILDEETKYYNLSISKDNPIKYLDNLDILDITGNAIIYIGYANCNVCRGVADILLETAEKNDIDTIYYLDITTIRDEYEIKDNKVTQTKEADKIYSEILKKTDKYTYDYVISSNGVEYEVGIKRIFAPAIVFIKDYEIIEYYDKFNAKELELFNSFNETEKEEIEEVIIDNFEELKN